MKKVVSIVLNNFTRDNRVLKENISLNQAGYETLIIALHEKDLAEEEVVEGIKVKRVKINKIYQGKSFIISGLKYFSFLYRAFKLTKSYDIIHCNDLETLPVGYFRKLLNRRVKVVYDAHEFEIFRSSHSHPTRLWLNKKIEKWFIKSANAVITVSDSIADEYVKMYNITRPYLIYNCPSNSFSDNKTYNIFREKFNIRPDQKIFIFQGALTFGRGIDFIIDSFSKMKTDKYVSILMGFGSYEAKIETASKENNNIYLHPAVDMRDIDMYTKSADWGLLTTEPISKNNDLSLPNKLFEYVMAEIPIIAFPTYEIKNKVKSNNIGIVADDFTTEALTKAIELASKTNSNSYKESLQKMKQEYNWENQDKVLIDIYKSL